MRPYHLARLCLGFVAAAVVSFSDTVRAQDPAYSPNSLTANLVPQTQNFNALGTGANPSITGSLPGWAGYSFPSAGATPPVPSTQANNPRVLTAVTDNGSMGAANIYNYGHLTTDPTDRALGMTLSENKHAITVGFTHNIGGTTLTAFDVAFRVEQWRTSQLLGGNFNLNFQYGFGTTYRGVTTWMEGGGGTDPFDQASAGTLGGSPDVGVPQDGNLTSNSVSKSGRVSGLNWQPGQTIWLRWWSEGSLNTVHGLGVDDFSFTPIPEPATVLGAAAVAGLGFAAVRRRRAARAAV